ncbi:uncharacterized protein OCT59_018881 [Rhizophagus irregularis]|uniref:uncharacterized protein n=1 Tax=Rhizophagus irregularis TaxID=588596 RepID=UPI0033241070|nr:hypothetical protein OCT59_018881 [Rhizophagus irregularis]
MNCNASVDYAKCKEKCGKRLTCGHEYLNECHECQKLSSQISGDTNVPIERAHHGKYSKLPETRRAVAILNKSGHCSKDHPYIIEEYNEASGCPDCNILVIN